MIFAPYLLIGLGVYLSAAAIRFSAFNDASTISIIKGIILGILLWPVGLYILYLAGKQIDEGY